MCVLSLIFHCIIVAQGEQSVKGSIMKNLSYFDTTWNLSVLNTDWVQDEKNKVINASKKITGCLNARLLLHSAISDEDAWGFVTHLRGYFYPNIHFFFSTLERDEYQGHRPSVSHLSQKFKTSYVTCHSSACSTAARNPREITVSLAFVCSEPSCMKIQNSPLRFFFQLYCTSICIQGRTLDLSPSAIHPANEVFMTQAFAFWYVISILFQLQFK